MDSRHSRPDDIRPEAHEARDGPPPAEWDCRAEASTLKLHAIIKFLESDRFHELADTLNRRASRRGLTSSSIISPEDILQETVLSAIVGSTYKSQSLEVNQEQETQVDEAAHFANFICGIANNKLKEALRRCKRDAHVSYDDVSCQLEAPSPKLDILLELLEIASETDQLAEPTKHILSLYLDGRKFSEIGPLLGMTDGSVKHHWRCFRDWLRQRICSLFKESDK